jgi:hypothetical protein
MCICLSGQLIAPLWPGRQQVWNAEFYGNIYGLRDTVAADELEDLAEVEPTKMREVAACRSPILRVVDEALPPAFLSPDVVV